MSPKEKRISVGRLQRIPFEHQMEAVQFLLKKKKAILADEMGAGKTLAAVLAMHNLSGKRLIVCPASLKLNWEKEIKMVTDAPIKLIAGKKWPKVGKNDWVILNYDILKNHMENIKRAKFKAVTFDEAHYCKSINNNGYGGSKRARYFIQTANLMEYVFLLTGTPITNKTKDVFNLLKAVKHPLSRNFKDFAKKHCAPEFNGYGWSYDGSSNQEELNEQLKPFMLRRLKGELLELPGKTRSFIPVDIDTKRYDAQVKDYMEKRSGLKGKNEHLVYLNAMRQILAKEKVKHTIDLTHNLLEQEQPVVIFTNYTAVVESLCEKFPEAVTIIGKNSGFERQRAVDEFQQGKTNLIICNLIAGGAGITLTRAKHMIIQDFDYVPANHLQAEDRIYRIGQGSKVNIDYVYGKDTLDEKMAYLLEDKLVNINKIVDDADKGFLDEVIGWFNGRTK